MSPIGACARGRSGTRCALRGAVFVLAVAAAASHAASRNWLGLGASDNWSDIANWNPAGLPLDGDDLVFGGNPARLHSTINLSLTLNSLRFEADSQLFELHVAGSGGHALAFGGLGIQNLTAGTGPIRQDFFADAGSSGGSITFAGGAGINLGSSGQYRPVNISALGGAAAGEVGGRIVFEGSSSTGTSTFTALRAEGARAGGAGAGSLLLRQAAVSTSTGIVVATGGEGLGSLGGQARFADDSQLQGRLNVLAGVGGGQGARAVFEGRAAALLQASLDNRGADSSVAGAEAVTTFVGQARLAASAINRAGTAAAANGGRIEFRDRAAFDSTGLDPNLGPVQVLNLGSDALGARGGSLVLADDSFTRGTLVVISNGVEVEGLVAGSAGGTTEFRDRSHAGSAAIGNAGAMVGSFLFLPTTAGGQTSFRHASSAGSARITSQGGRMHSALGGRLDLFDDASAATALILNDGAEFDGAHGGLAHFADRSSAAGASVFNGGGRVAGALGGQLVFSGDAGAGSAALDNFQAVAGAQGGRTLFSGRSEAGTATITNHTPLGALGGSGIAGATAFNEFASARQATIINLGAWHNVTPEAGGTRFAGDSSAGTATIYNLGGRGAGARGGSTLFVQRATAGNARFVVRSGAAIGAGGGTVEFFDQANAGSALFEVDGPASFANVSQGALYFFDRASAANSTLQLGGSQVAGLLGATASFTANATADQASIAVGGGAAGGARGARVDFGAAPGFQASAGQARIDNQRATVAAASGGSTLFGAHSTAAQSRIVNQGADFATGDSGAVTVFSGNASAGGADIRNEGGRVAGGIGGSSLFGATADAGDAAISNAAGMSAGAAGSSFGGTTLFGGSSSAQRARIVNHAATDDLASFGGATFFNGSSSAGSARISAEGSANATRAGGLIHFSGGSAASATLVAEGATGAGGQGGMLGFGGNANADQATLTAGSGVAGGNGGVVRFADTTSAGRARAVVEGGAGRSPGVLDISALGLSGTTIGSIEGGGVVNLGGKLLRSGGNHRETTFSGLIHDGGSGGSLLVEGNGKLTLTGANTYSGRTTVADGSAAGRGKLVVANTSGSATGSGPVHINRGGTLGGSGFIAGPVTLRAGGIIAPGDPVTLTLQSSLTWHGGGVIRLALGADTAGSDQLVLGGDLVRGEGGVFLFDLVDFGAVVGQQYELLRFDNLVGFEAGDFSFSGIGGDIALAAGGLLFTANAVPEPASAWLLLVGVLVLGRRYASQRCGSRSAASKACT